jgi:FkbM family methyltransferase
MKQLIQRLMHKMGREIVPYHPNHYGYDHIRDIKRLLSATEQPIVFDVGANVGQTVATFREALPQSVIHSFEPSPTAFKKLKQHAGVWKNVHLNNVGVGSSVGSLELLENLHSDMTSFLRPGSTAWGKVVNRTEVPVLTLDSYCAKQGIQVIDLLKTDTQGYDLEVLKGCEELMRANRIQAIFCEVNFSEMYEDMPRYDQLLGFLANKGFKLMAFYKFHHMKNGASWSDALFALERSVNKIEA